MGMSMHTSRGYPWTYWRIPKCVTGLITRRIMVPDLFFLELMLLLLAASQFPINFPSCQLILPSFQCSLFFSFQQVFLKVFQVSNCFQLFPHWGKMMFVFIKEGRDYLTRRWSNPGGSKAWGPPIRTEPIAAQGLARPGGGAFILARVAAFF